MFTSAIRNGFRKCGLFPFNPDNVDYTKCIKRSHENMVGDGDNLYNVASVSEHLAYVENKIESMLLNHFKICHQQNVNPENEQALLLFQVWKNILTETETSYVRSSQNNDTEARQNQLLDVIEFPFPEYDEFWNMEVENLFSSSNVDDDLKSNIPNNEDTISCDETEKSNLINSKILVVKDKEINQSNNEEGRSNIKKTEINICDTLEPEDCCNNNNYDPKNEIKNIEEIETKEKSYILDFKNDSNKRESEEPEIVNCNSQRNKTNGNNGEDNINNGVTKMDVNTTESKAEIVTEQKAITLNIQNKLDKRTPKNKINILNNILVVPSSKTVNSKRNRPLITVLTSNEWLEREEKKELEKLEKENQKEERKRKREEKKVEKLQVGKGSKNTKTEHKENIQENDQKNIKSKPMSISNILPWNCPKEAKRQYVFNFDNDTERT